MKRAPFGRHKELFRKIGVKSRTQAVVWAIGKGLVKPGGAEH